MRIRRLLIANRGEIALRIIQTCRRLGIESVLVVSEPDADSLPARRADHVVPLGGRHSGESYLDIEKVIAAAKLAEVDAVHPGYGFLSEKAAFAEACAEAGIIFIGPTPEQLEAFGDKLKARSHAEAAGLSPVPGGNAADLEEARAIVEELKLPVLIKAVGGGGGRGMKPVFEAAELESAFNNAVSEAQAAFGDPRVYIEAYVSPGRHVEVQILGDGERFIHLGTRDCSVQRRYQKLIEEAPAPDLPDSLREGMHEAAVQLARSLKYRGLGTVELLVDPQREAFYFLEMNARIQVEHPVTEMICGIDLVEQQIRVAEGEPLSLRQEDVTFSGHSFECRLNAEDWRHDFRPDPGRIDRVVFPAGEGIRVDSHMQNGAVVPPYYDSMVAKLIVHGSDRKDALRRLDRALAACRLEGIETTIPMHRALINTPDFSSGAVSTQWYKEVAPKLLEEAAADG
jgi:acetyl-CoA carboxylase biotin carboxylase subunit